MIRRRSWIRTMKTCLHGAVASVVVMFGIALWRSPHFEVRSVVITGLRTLPKERVMFYAQDLIGKPAIYPPKRAVSQRILRIPEVESVRFNRFPSLHMTVHVTERQPYFLLQTRPVTGEGASPSPLPIVSRIPTFWVADRHGVLFRVEHRRLPGLPLVQMTTDRVWRLGDRLGAQDLRHLQRAFAAVQRTKTPTPERYFYDRGFLSLRLPDQTLVRLGNDAWERKLRRVHRALAFLQKTQQRAEYIDFTSADVPTWKERAKKVNL
ncbi:MAG: FtsQ-type POTRA domain-containing protein [Abditibacteriales bacterium]|nr:FtsQ-type POTRA domain-containing protein [Abditibacteriales bacterium]MDW8367040.1 FtsQ-type POTRA domain-containing protein [Abditibacteriales bacterium]